jgi:hypothetical protein
MKTLRWFVFAFLSILLVATPRLVRGEYPYDDEVTVKPADPVASVDVKLEVDSSNMTGVKFVAPEDGSYTVTIDGGAFCYLPENTDSWALYGGWSSLLHVYENHPVKWGAPDEWGKHPVDFTTTVGEGKRAPSVAAAAAAAGKGSSVTIDLKKGDYIVLIVSDGYDYYADNSGAVTVRITGP